MRFSFGIEDELSKLSLQVKYFCDCVTLCISNGDEDDEEILEAWTTILHDAIGRIVAIACGIKEEFHWTLLGTRKDMFRALQLDFKKNCQKLQNYHLDESMLSDIRYVQQILDQGAEGFRYMDAEDRDYYTELFEQEYAKFKTQNIERVKLIYQQDSNDKMLDCPDDNQRKTKLFSLRRDDLFETHYGKVYHDNGRDLRKLTLQIIEDEEPNYTRIHEFMSAYLSFQYAEEKMNERVETAASVINYIFKPNVDVDKVMKMLVQFVENKTIKAQRHWYVVYKVFLTKKWLAKDAMTKFRDQMNCIFRQKLRCTEDDFKQVDSYFKNNDYSDWCPADRDAPQCCNDYLELATLLDKEFVEEKYAKPGTRINTPKRIKS